MMRNKNFAKTYGVLIQDGAMAGLTARVVLVLDKNDQVIYTELVSDIVNEPDYEKAIAALRSC
jgi:thiol peroxidase